jgi:hypothetical protein
MLNLNTNLISQNRSEPKKKCCCTYCGKGYTKKTSLEKHVLICSIIYKSKRELKIEEEESTDIPSHKELYNIIKELTFKINQLEEKVTLQQKFIDKKKKKINVVEWLNNNVKTSQVFDDFINNSIIINEEDVIFMMNNSFLDTLDKVFAENLSREKQKLGIPIFCFSEKQNTFYIYSNNTVNSNTNPNPNTQQTTPQSWMELNRNDCIRFLNIIYSKIFKKLMEWKKDNEQNLNGSEKLEDIYIKTVSKIMSIEFKNEATLSKTKTILYNILKTDMKNIIEYQFDF